MEKNMNDKFTLELDEEFLELFYALVNEIPPNKSVVSLEDFKRVIQKIKNLGFIPQKKDELFGAFSPADENRKSVLIVDDLGTITYQLSTMFSKIGYNTTCSKEIYDAISKYKKQHYNIVILDLYIPTEREGFLLLDEILKINDTKAKKSIVGIMTASNKKEHKQICRDRGAAFYVEKVDNWQKNLIEMCNRLSSEQDD